MIERGRGSVSWRSWAVLGILLVSSLVVSHVDAASLRGSKASLKRQNSVAEDHDFTYLRTSSQVRQFVRAGYLVPVDGNANYELIDVSYPYARPEVRTFIERLSRQYRSACGEALTITSLTRPSSDQPFNASPLSVHPTGMAIDIRRSNRKSCQSWIEGTLLYLEDRKVLEATREARPPHYHVAVYPEPYSDYVNSIGRRGVSSETYRVRAGDSLWSIARSHSTTVASIRKENDLRTTRIFPGQMLKIP